MIEQFTEYTFQATEDGSFTLRLIVADDATEAMHSMRGAFSETSYIYGEAMRTALSSGSQFNVLSMGLGLGYVEILAAGLWLAANTKAPLAGESFEIVEDLRDYFLGWLTGDDCPGDFAKVYDDILKRTAKETGAVASEIKVALAKAVDNGNWKIRAALEPSTQFSRHFSVVCFDAFSSKSTPDLWTEDFLNAFLEKACADSCVLSTYACTGSLKRALRHQGFAVTIREGFSSKRDSTFARRG
jgi:tRNA U34 5-methylaminomethyl-2-thiouridine-forming methyltransferase MnmC